MKVHYIDKTTNQSEANMEILKGQIQDADSDQLASLIEHLESEWCLNQIGDTHLPFKIGFDQFCRKNELDENGVPTSIDVGRVSSQYKRQVEMLGQMYHRAFALNISDTSSCDINGNEFTYASRVNRLIRVASASVRIVMSYTRIQQYVNNPTSMPENAECDPALFDASTIAIDELSPYQQLILVVLNETYNNNIRRYKGQCCKEIEIADGGRKYRTKAWKPLMQIAEYVYTIAQKESRFEVWKNLTARGSTARDAIKHLSECNDMQFPEIKKNRHVWSFNNGLFVGKEWNIDTGKYTCRFYPYDSTEFACLDPTIVSSKYFEKYFPNYDHIENWWDIPTPHFQSIMDYQGFEPEVAKWLYVMGGKMCFDVGDIDSWQVIPFLKGIARSGKSTIITKVFKKFYDSDDVRTLSNNIERKFGLSSIYDGFMFIAPEVKGDLCLEQAEFQSLVSGEDVSIAQKYEKAKSVEWKTPGILGGNEVPNWKDNSGSILRRLLPWNFGKQVMNADPHLDDKLDAELPAILLKCVKGYLDYAQKYSNQDIWNVVPKYFKNVQEQVAMVTSSLQHFLASGNLSFGSELFLPHSHFMHAFNDHCTQNNLGKPKFNPDFYAGPFSARGIEVKVMTRTYMGQMFVNKEFIIGVDIASRETSNTVPAVGVQDI
jgi:hypothetical protein